MLFVNHRIYVSAFFLLLFFQMSAMPQSLSQADLSFDSLSPEKRIIAYNDAAERLNIKGINQIYEYADQALLLLKRYPNDQETARTYYHLARVSFYLGRYSLALSDASIALNLAKKEETRYLILSLIADIYVQQDSYTLARETYKKLAKFKQVNKVENLLAQSAVARELKYFSSAKRAAEEAYHFLEKKDDAEKTLVAIELGRVLWGLQNREAAMTVFYQAISSAEKSQNSEYMAKAYTAISEVLLETGNYKQTIFYSQKALLANRGEVATTLTSKIYELLYEGFLGIGEPIQAINMLKFQYDNDLLILRNQQRLSEDFFDNSIKIQSLEEQLTLAKKKHYEMVVTIVILLSLIAIAVIVIVILGSRTRHLEVQIQASILAYNSIKTRTEHMRHPSPGDKNKD